MSLAKNVGHIANLEMDPTLNNDIAIDEGGWGDDDEDIEDESEEKKNAGDGEAGWDVEDADLEIPDLGMAQQTTSVGFVHLPTIGPSLSNVWTKNSQLPFDHFAAGSFESAFRLLHEQVSYYLTSKTDLVKC